MPNMDAVAKAAVAGPAFAPAFFLSLDISGDPLRVTNFATDTPFAGTGDPDLDGNTFVAFGGQLLDFGDVGNSDSGSDTLTVTLSGILNMNASLLNDMGNKSLWQGRECRIWFRIYDESGTQPQGAIVPFYTGYMSSVEVDADDQTQQIVLNVENYLAAFNQASNRSYLNQKDYDPNDTSAQATMAAANGLRRDTGAGAGAGGIGPGTGGSLIGGTFPMNFSPLAGDMGGGASYGTWGSDGMSPTAKASQ